MRSFLQSPYFDDYDENKKFYASLFRPSFPVQARELNQINSMLQKQVERLGNHLFKNGSMVLDGQMQFDNNVTYVKLQPGFTTNINNLVDTILTNGSIKAKVVAVEPASGEDPATLYVKFVENSASDIKWSPGQTLSPYDDLVISDEDDSVGLGSAATIQRGVYYVKGYFVLVDKQTIILEKYNNVPSYRVGLRVVESIITPENDETLLDNAQGSYNYAAPGAHRYMIELKLDKVSLSNKTDSEAFIELGQIQSGRIVKQVTKTEYSDLEKTLARRTYDESGDYTVTPFKMSVREHRNNDRGQWKLGSKYLIGDVVRNFNHSYVALTSGEDKTGSGPSHLSGAVAGAEKGMVTWEYVAKPVFNNGVYPAEGKVSKVVILDGGTGYITPPTVIFNTSDTGGSGVKATAVISEGKVVNVILDDCGSGFNTQTVEVTFDGGLASKTDPSLAEGEIPKSASAVAYTDAGDSEKLALGLEGGKAYVRGFEIDKIGTTWVDVDKAREKASVESVYLTPTVGNYLKVTDITGVPTVGGIVEIHNTMIGHEHSAKTLIGTARVRGFELEDSVQMYNDDVDSIQYKNVYKLFVYDLNVTGNLRTDAKSVKIGNTFAGNIEFELVQLQGGIRITDSTITGSGTKFYDELRVGDYIRVKDDFIRITALADRAQTTATISKVGVVDNTSTFEAFYLTAANLYEPQGGSCVYPLPHTCIDNTSVDNIAYRVVNRITATVTEEGKVEFSANVLATSKTTVQFASGSEDDNYILIHKGSIVSPEQYTIQVASDGSIVTVAPTNAASSNLVTDFNTKGQTFDLMATVIKEGLNAGVITKKLSNLRSKFFKKKGEVHSNILKLGVVDVLTIESIKMYPSIDFDAEIELDSLTSGVDITDRYDFYDGQTESYYGESYVKLKSSFSAPNCPVAVFFKCLERVGEGDYYSAESYMVTEEIDGKKVKRIDFNNVPVFKGMLLSDTLDFRPDVLADGSLANATSLKRGTEVRVGYEYYLGRKDRICLDYRGNYVNVQGVPSLDPKLAEMPTAAMNIANLDVKPYTFSVNDVLVETIDNKRYTMRDIGRLENRISTLEQYTSLSLLEVQTESMLIQDGDNFDRFKQGFVVDNFKSNKLLSTNDPSRCSIDVEQGICRPPFISNHVSLFEHMPTLSKTSDAANQRKAAGYMLYGKVYTLPLDENNPHVPIVEQPLATRIENINPFAVATYVGMVFLNPASDDWYDTNYLPDVINNVEGNYLSTKKAQEGTVWNDWQVSWTGAKVTTNTSTNVTSDRTLVSSRTSGGGWNDRWITTTNKWNTTTTTTTTTAWAQDIGQTRTGLKTIVTATTDYETIGDKIVSTTSIPYMRSRWLLVRATKLKPYTVYKPKFDGVDVDYWCVPAAKFEYKPVSGKFDCTSGAGSDTSSVARRIDATKHSYWREETDRTCLDVGDVITGKSSGATAVVVGVSRDPSYANPLMMEDVLYVVNIKDRDGKPFEGATPDDDSPNYRATNFFETGETIEGSISGARGTLLDYHETNRNHVYEKLKTNSAGELYFMFWIPDGDKIEHGTSTNETPVFQFKCGDRVLGLYEDDGNALTSTAEAVYSAVGIINNHERTVNAIRNAVVSTENLSENRTVIKTGTDVNVSVSNKISTSTSRRDNPWFDSGGGGDGGGEDPLAQTFTIGDNVTGGCFLSKVDLYFASKPTGLNALPVTVQIRTVENGVPTGTVLPFASVTLRPDQINISETEIEYVDENGHVVTTRHFDTPTSFVFESPVYVEDTDEYAIVILSDSTDYHVWIAQVGDTVPGQTTLVSQQPHIGVLLKSQNASTWSPSQMQDLKFTLYRANFQISESNTGTPKEAILQFASQPSVKRYMMNNPFETVEGSSQVRVWYDNHGFTPEMKVKFENANPNDVDSTIMLSGTISVEKGETTVNGIDTLFEQELAGLGSDKLAIELFDAEGKSIGTVAKIISDYELTLSSGAEVAVNRGAYSAGEDILQANGIPFEILEGTEWTVKYADLNSFVIDLDECGEKIEVTSSGYSGGSYFMCAPIINYEVIQPTINYLTFSDTELYCGLRMRPGTDTPNTLKDDHIVVSGIADNDNNVLTQSMAIYNEENREDLAISEPDLILDMRFKSYNSCLSPMVDSERCSAILINNVIDNPYVYDDVERKGVTREAFDRRPVTTSDLGKTPYKFDGHSIVSLTEGCAELFASIPVGMYIEVNYQKDNTANDKGTFTALVEGVQVIDETTVNVKCDLNFTANNMLGASYVVDTANGDAVTLLTMYIDEIAPSGGSVYSKYITKPINLSNTCDYLRIMFAGCTPKGSSIDLYYKAYQSSGSKQYDDVPWIYHEPGTRLTTVEVGSETFQDVKHDITTEEVFDTIAVKIVFRSTNAAAVPMIKDLRVIACI